MFGDSNINKLISSLDDMRRFSKRYFDSQTKAYTNLEKWAAEDNNNNAINDFATKFLSIFKKFESDFKKDKLDAMLNLANVFKKFKEYDSQMKSERKTLIELERKEKIYVKKMKSCEHEQFKDYEIKHAKTRAQKQKTQIKMYELGQDIETTKSILFKKNVKSLVKVLQEQNEAERVLLEAMEDLVEQMPDVTSEEVDNLYQIRYDKQAETEHICHEAKQKLDRVTSTFSLHSSKRRSVPNSSPEMSSPNMNRSYQPYSPPPTPPSRQSDSEQAFTARVWSTGGEATSVGSSPIVPSAPSIDELEINNFHVVTCHS